MQGSCRVLVAGVVGLVVFSVAAPPAWAAAKVTAGRNAPGSENAEFKVGEQPRPWKDDAAKNATFTLVDGARDFNSPELTVLNDGNLPANEDEPAANFFFNIDTEGGRIVADLKSAITVKQINTFSWHMNTRGPQVYKVYGADGTAAGFNARPGADVADPAKAGWTLIAEVDTRAPDPDREKKAETITGPDGASACGATAGGQHAVSIADEDPNKNLGTYRYLLFVVDSTDLHSEWDNTFFSEIDVVDANSPPKEQASGEVKPGRGDRPDPDGL